MVAGYLEYPCDVDITRRDPVEELRLVSGDRLDVIAGCGAGGSYFLCGDGPVDERPVLYADSEGGAGLIATSLREALELMLGLPYWRDRPTAAELAESPGLLDEPEEELREKDPDLDAGLPAARTVPDFLVRTTDGTTYAPF